MLQAIHAESLTHSKLRTLTRGEYDELAFGVIELDREFCVRTYNRSESALARRPPQATIGRHFFRDVAPCTASAEFHGRISALMADDVAVDTEVRFDYDFAFPWGRRRVRIRALRGTDSCWLFVTPLQSFDKDG